MSVDSVFLHWFAKASLILFFWIAALTMRLPAASATLGAILLVSIAVFKTNPSKGPGRGRALSWSSQAQDIETFSSPGGGQNTSRPSSEAHRGGAGGHPPPRTSDGARNTSRAMPQRPPRGTRGGGRSPGAAEEEGPATVALARDPCAASKLLKGFGARRTALDACMSFAPSSVAVGWQGGSQLFGARSSEPIGGAKQASITTHS